MYRYSLKKGLYVAAAPVENKTSYSSSFCTTPVVTNRLSSHYENLKRASDIEAARSQVEDALSLIRLLAPKYYYWIVSVIDEVVALDGGLGNRSGSDCAIPGVVCLSVPSQMDFVVEALVHEAAHQHFYKAENSIGHFVIKNCKDLGYSPIRKKMRPISKILLAYHAIINTLLLFFILRKGKGEFYDISSRHILWLDEMSSQFETQLLKQSVFTECGHIFFHSIKKRKDLEFCKY